MDVQPSPAPQFINPSLQSFNTRFDDDDQVEALNDLPTHTLSDEVHFPSDFTMNNLVADGLG